MDLILQLLASQTVSNNIIPWHYDTHITFKNKIKKNEKLKNKKILRYMVLTDWD